MTGQPYAMPPYVGAASTETGPVCVYAPRPDVPHCAEPATRHLLVHAHPAGHQPGLVTLASCEVHAPLARQAGTLVDEHEYAAGCAGPESVWLRQDNVCAPPTVIVPAHWGDER